MGGSGSKATDASGLDDGLKEQLKTFAKLKAMKKQIAEKQKERLEEEAAKKRRAQLARDIRIVFSEMARSIEEGDEDDEEVDGDGESTSSETDADSD